MNGRKVEAHLKALKDTYEYFTFKYAHGWSDGDWAAVNRYYLKRYERYKTDK